MRSLPTTILLCCILFVSSCAMQHRSVLTPETRAMFMRDLQEGRPSLQCHVNCDLRWLMAYRKMMNYHSNAKWHELVELVMQIGAKNGVSYYFLGKAASGLGYDDAAIKYFGYSITAYEDPTLKNHCELGMGLGQCGDIDYNYEIPLLIAQSQQNIASAMQPPPDSSTPKVNSDPGKKEVPTPDPQIRSVQEKLIQKGYNPGAPDGLMGRNTREALREFQRDSNLAVTGKLNEETINYLSSTPVKNKATYPAPPSPSTEANIAKSHDKALPQTNDSSVHLTHQASTIPAPMNEKLSPALPLSAATTTPVLQTESAQSPMVQGKGLVTESTSVLSHPSIMGNRIGNITAGNTVEIVDKKEKFFMIKYQGGIGYIYGDFIQQQSTPVNPSLVRATPSTATPPRPDNKKLTSNVEPAAASSVQAQSLPAVMPSTKAAAATPTPLPKGEDEVPKVKGKGVVAESTNVLSQPSIMGDTIGSIATGAKIEIIEKRDRFLKIKYQDGIGYIYADFVREQE